MTNENSKKRGRASLSERQTGPSFVDTQRIEDNSTQLPTMLRAEESPAASTNEITEKFRIDGVKL